MPDALRVLARDVCSRRRVLPLSLGQDGDSRVLRIAMADPTDTAAVPEIENLTLRDRHRRAAAVRDRRAARKGYRGISTAVVHRGTMFVTGKAKVVPSLDGEEISVTAQIPISALRPDDRDLDTKLTALISVLVAKGVLTEAELAEAIRKLG